MRIVIVILFVAAFVSCNNAKKVKGQYENPVNKVYLETDTLNVATMKDTMIIYQGVCRGCAYENSTEFRILDSLEIVKYYSTRTFDNNPADMDGGSISKHILIIPDKLGRTTIKLFRDENFNRYPPNQRDSIIKNAPSIATYNIEVKNQ